ncbi:MAG: AI-2E family transporter [Dehalococcoidales bacterium]|nr:AI-2E family transporter [Dehalococcoidales bacterium]
MAAILNKHWRLVAVLLGIIILLWVLYLLRTVVLPFAIGLVFAYILEPAVYWLAKRLPPRRKSSTQRFWATLIVLIIVFGIFGNATYFIGRLIFDASAAYLKHSPFYFMQGFQNIQLWLGDLFQQFSPEIQQEMQGYLAELGNLLGTGLRQLFTRSVSTFTSSVNTVMGFIALPFFLFYIMKDSAELKKSLVSIFSPSVAEHVRGIALIVEKVFGRYIRAQMMLGLIVGYFAFVGLLLLDIPFSPILGLLAGITEVIPTVGPWIGGGVAALVTMALAPDKVVWVIILFVSIQMLENAFLVPRVHSAYLRIHPAIMIVLLVLGTYLAGFWGLLLIGPMASTFVEIYKYVRKEVDVERSIEGVKEKVEVKERDGNY